MDEFDLIGQIAKRGAAPVVASDGTAVELPLPGDFIGKLRIEAVLGHGGIGVVFKAVDPATESPRAIKIPYPDTSRRDIDRFRVEAKICGNLDHPNIVRVYNVDLYRETLPYAEMDFVDGLSVFDRIREKPLPMPVALSIIVVLCRALEYAHAQKFSIDGTTYEKMVHRDIKPANILISGMGVVKLADFGLAKFEGVDLHTITGAMPGTVPYMAPEQHHAPVASVRTDVYSLGVTLYEMITGRRPFPEKGVDAFAQLVTAKLEGTYAPAGRINAAFHAGIDDLIKRCLNPEAGKRYPSYAALRIAAEAITGEYADLDAEDLVRLYFSNRKNYRVAVTERPRSRFRMTKTMAVAAVTFMVAVTALALLNYGPSLWTGFVGARDRARPAVPVIKQPGSVPSRQSATVNASSDERPAATAAPRVGAAVAKKTVAAAGRMKNGPPAPPAEASVPEQSSPLAAGAAAWRAGRFAEAAGILRALSAGGLLAVQRDSAALIVLDAYYRTGAVNEALVYGSENPVNDGTHHLLMALLYDAAGMRREAEAAFARSLAAPCAFDPPIAGKRYLYRARFYRKAFDESRLPKDRETMLQAWRDFLRHGCDRASAECDDARRIVGGGGGER